MSKTSTGMAGLAGDLAGQVRRSPMEMVCDILGVVSQGPTKPTHILYKANMSWKVLSSYLDYLTSKGMISKEEEEGGKRSTYRLTAKGMSILKLYEGLKESLSGNLNSETASELTQLVSSGFSSGSVAERRSAAFRW